jgi:hypothetical protein
LAANRGWMSSGSRVCGCYGKSGSVIEKALATSKFSHNVWAG